MPQRNHFSGKVEFDVHKMKKSKNYHEILRGPIILFGLGIIKLAN